MAQRFRERLAQEQQRLGYSDAGLAKRVSALGLKMTGATIWKIKVGEPPRKVDLDEAHALARALGYESAQQMLDGPETFRVWAMEAAAAVCQHLALAERSMQAGAGALVDFERIAADLGPDDAADLRRGLARAIDDTQRRIAEKGEQMKARMRGEATDQDLGRPPLATMEPGGAQ